MDYVPTIFAFKQNAKAQSEKRKERLLRLQQRKARAAQELTTAPTETSVSMSDDEAETFEYEVSVSGVETGFSVCMTGSEDGVLENPSVSEAETGSYVGVSGVETGAPSETLGTVGTEVDIESLSGMSTSGVVAGNMTSFEAGISANVRRAEAGSLAGTAAASLYSRPSAVAKAVQAGPTTSSKRVQADFLGFSASFMEGNDTMTKFYTGLPSWDVFEHVYSIVAPHVPKKWSTNSKLQPRDELLLVLMRLRLNTLIEDLAYRFGIAKSTVTTICNLWIDVMSVRLKFLIKWADKEVIDANMPKIFRETYPLTRCIIDCSEIFIERPVAYQARAKTYSNYKKHNTAKFLIAISPSGSISFISTVWGGRVSDKVITQKSGFLDLLDPGDTVLADRGFTISEDLRLHGAKSEIPSFTRGKSQLTQREVEFSQRLARVRIHVERVIGLMKNKYTILQGILPITVISHKHDTEDFSNLDKILVTCAALTNLSPCIVPS